MESQVKQEKLAKARIEKAEPVFIEMFGYEPMFYGHICEYADLLEDPSVEVLYEKTDFGVGD